jgi:CHAD domain-containing protein
MLPRPKRAVPRSRRAIDPADRFVDATYRILLGQFEPVVTKEAGARAGKDPEFLHDMRVATRRLRTALRLFGNALPETRVSAARSQLKWIGAGLGPARDLDVQLARLRAGFRSADEAGHSAREAFAGWLDARREQARAKMLRVLDSARFRRFLAAFGSYLRKGPPRRPRAPQARRAISAVAPDLILPALGDLLRRGRRLTHCHPARKFHRFRVRCKRVRYLCEFLTGLYGAPAKRTASRLVKAQDALGALQDAIVGQALLAEFMRETRGKGGPPRGNRRGEYSLAAWYIGRAEEARRAFARAWRRLRRPGHRKALARAIERIGT